MLGRPAALAKALPQTLRRGVDQRHLAPGDRHVPLAAVRDLFRGMGAGWDGLGDELLAFQKRIVAGLTTGAVKG